ncbi:dihydroxy-acid dehydratase [Candidatus Woesearchaeota archaeon]|nr:dihydroxy-acid dehydratase [Candidatus Woesearchaeota archaeon]
MRSEILKKGAETLPHRALLMSAGMKAEDFDQNKPFIGIANSYNDIIPGHIHLNELTKEVKRGIRDAGGVALEWGVPGVCDGIAMYVEMRLSLPSREHIADNIEIMTISHSLDGWVGVTNCDKITPGMLMAAGRMDIPSIILTGGPMKANIIEGKKRHPIEGFGLTGQVKSGKLKEGQAEKIMRACSVCGAGSCVGLYTANTMACFTETVGMSLTGCAATPALDSLKKKQAYETGKRIVEMVKKNIRPSSIMTKEAFENGIRADMTMGGSTNAVLHIPAIAKELGIDIDVNMFDRIAKETPNICKLIPAGSYEMADLHKAGGVAAVLNRVKDMLKESQTVNGKTIKEIAENAKVLDDDIIRELDNPYFREGGIAVLRGNIADSSIIKQTAVSEDMMKHKGPARVFTSEADLLKAIENKDIEEGDVIVLNFMGPAGAPGMPEMLTPTDAIKGAGYKRVPLITDGRFSGGTSGPCVGHVEMEAYNGGAIRAIKDGDMIEIDVPGRKLNVKLSEEEIRKRLEQVKAPQRKMTPLLMTFREKYIGKNCYGK